MRKLILFLVTAVTALRADGALAAGVDPAVIHWAEAFEAAMTRRDAGAAHTRHALVLTGPGRSADRDAVCEPLPKTRVAAALGRIASRQWLGRPLDPTVAAAAAAAIARAMPYDSAEFCEWAELTEHPSGARHRQVHAFRLAPRRLQRDFRVVVETRWVPPPDHR